MDEFVVMMTLFKILKFETDGIPFLENRHECQ